MLNHQVDLVDWGAFFDGISRQVGQELSFATARVFTVRPGIIEGEEAWARLIGLTWELDANVLTVALDGLDNRIENPQEIWFSDTLAGGRALGARHLCTVIARLRCGAWKRPTPMVHI